MTTAIIIDDEALARENIKNHLDDFSEIKVVAECANGFEGFKAINEHQPQLVFLDIQMPKINGFEMLELIDNRPAIIFTTAFDEYALKAFEKGAVDYLLKPFPKERFNQAIKKYLSQEKNYTGKAVEEFTIDMPERQNRIVVKDKDNIRIIPVEDIRYIEANDDYVMIYTEAKKHLKKATMQLLEKSLNPNQFIRVHRSYLININQLSKIEPYGKNNHIGILRQGAKIPISRSGYALLKDKLGI